MRTNVVTRPNSLTASQVPRCHSLTPRQQSVLVGTVLGDAYLSKRSNPKYLVHLQLNHALKQRSYLEWKVAELYPLFLDHVPVEYSRYDRRSSKTHYSVQAFSYSHPILTEFRHLFYLRPNEECTPHVHKKMITPEILEMVDDLALAVWYLDDGSYHLRRGYVSLHVGGVSEQEYRLVSAWFLSRGFHPRIDIGKRSCKAFRLTLAESEVFLSRIRPYVPECMNYKLGIAS